MTCIIPRPIPGEVFERYKNMFSATVLGGGEIIPESNEWYVISLEYAVHEEFMSFAEQQWKERDPRFACCDNLYKLAEANGVYPRAAGFSEGYVQLTGTPNASIRASSLEVVFADQNFRSIGNIPATLDANGTAVVRFRALVSGAGGNVQSSATTGRLITPIEGVNQTVTIFGGQFCGGTEAETCEEFRTRYLARRQYQPRATDAWLQQKLLEWPCVTRVCRRGGNCCTIEDGGDCANNCAGKLEFYVFFDDTFECGLAPQCVVDEITDWLFGDPQGYGLGQVEIGVCGNIYTATPAKIDVVIDGIACVTPSQEQLINERLADFFTTICPSTMIFTRQIETVIAQVIGSASNFDVVLRTDAEGVTITDCGIDPDCDVMPCLGEISYVYDRNTVGSCV